MPNTETRYRNPVVLSTIFCSLVLGVLGEARNTVARPSFEAAAEYASASSRGMSGRIKPSIPHDLACPMNFSKPAWTRMFE